jgi:acetamidase/formamidase
MEPVMKFFILILLLFTTIFIKCQSIVPVANVQGKAEYINFRPGAFYHKFSANIDPVLRIHPGDTILTETVDAAGFDKTGKKREQGGNPLTGPFFIEGSSEGDVLAVTITKLILNRSTAFTTESFSSRSLPKGSWHDDKKVKIVNWKVDTSAGFAILNDTAYEHLRDFKVPLRPFLGCIGVAPANSKNEILSFFQGPFGGNLDFERITQSATVYLPVFHEGAYLYVGDGHALEGDGEIAGNALETSLDIEFVVSLIKKESLRIDNPRVEDSADLMAIGVDKSLDNALKIATAELLAWLQNDYHLSSREATQVMSTSIEYQVAEIADPNVEVVARIKKDILKQLKK